MHVLMYNKTVKKWDNWEKCVEEQVIASCPDTCKTGWIRGHNMTMIAPKGLTAQLTKVDLNMVNEPWVMSPSNYVLFIATALVFTIPCFCFRNILCKRKPPKVEDKP